MRTSLVALICCLLVAVLAGATVVAGAPSSPAADATVVTDGPRGIESSGDLSRVGYPSISGSDTVQSDESGDSPRPESIEVTIESDGDATFVLVKEFPIETAAEQRAFDRLADEYERGGQGDLGFSAFETSFETVVADVDREMELVDDGRHASQSGDVGRLEYRFTWTNFAQVDEETVVVGDSFQVDGTVWLELYDGQRLVVQAPDGYNIAESPSGPEIDGNALIWTGPATFEAGDLTVTFDQSDSGSAFPMQALLAILGLLVFAMVAVAGWWVLREEDEGSIGNRIGSARESVGRTVGDTLPGTSPNGGGSGSGDSADGGGTTAVSDAEPSAAADSPEAGATSEDEVDPELLSDEERVENLLERNGGRMKQATIVSETGWSNAKVSQLLSSMDEEGRVDKLRIGRENLITLPDVDVTDQE